jgi:hypothetical protein
MTTSTDILESIDNRLRQLREELAALEAAQAALYEQEAPERIARAGRGRRGRVAGKRLAAPTVVHGSSDVNGTAAPSPGPEPRPASRRRRSARRTRKPQVATSETIMPILEGGEAMTTAALAERVDADRDQVLGVLRELEALGQVRRTGQRRSTRWRAITDEERIEQRAAELAALSRAAA